MTQEIPPIHSKKEFFDSLPRKRNAVGLLIFKESKILILKPTYKKSWLVPGGIVESYESLSITAERECLEEIGLKPQITKLLVVDYKTGDHETGDAIHFIFEAKICSDAKIKINSEEIESFLWEEPDLAYKLLDPNLSKRVQSAIEASTRQTAVYCEDGIIRF